MPKHRKCEVCSKKFKVKTTHHRFCCKRCQRAARYARVHESKSKIINCSQCGCEMVGNERKKYCSPTCRRSYKKLDTKECIICRARFLPNRGNEKYCSNECRRKKSPPKCRTCAKEYVRNYRYQRYCSEKCKTDRPTSDRNWEMTKDLLMPTATLAEVGKEYGLTRERVRQVFERTIGVSHTKVRRSLMEASERFICKVCGSTMKSGVCPSYKCKVFRTEYCLDKPAECDQCGREFYRYRNWKASAAWRKAKLGRGPKTKRGTFCSQACYHMSIRRQDNWSKNQIQAIENDLIGARIDGEKNAVANSRRGDFCDKGLDRGA